MAKRNNMIIAGTDCKKCDFFKEKDNDKIICLARNKTYFYGQYVPCDDKKKK